MRKSIFSLLLLFTLSIHAQTTLTPGDIAFVGYNQDNNIFSFVLLADIETSTEIFFTDCGITNPDLISCNGSSDTTVSWISNSDMPAGSVITLTDELSLNGAGDQIFAYQGSSSNPSFIAGIHATVVSRTEDEDWDGTNTSGTTTALPDALTNGVTAIRVHIMDEESDNWQFNCSLVPNGISLSGSSEELATLINTLEFWAFDNDNPFDPSADPDCTFNVNTETQAPVITCPPDRIVSNDVGNCSATLTLEEPTATDVDSTEFTFTGLRSDQAALDDSFPVGTTTITWTAIDESGNSSESCTQIIQIDDIENPLVICQAVSLELDATGLGTLTADMVDAGSSDNCTLVSLSLDRTDFSIEDVGVQTVMLTATDDSGNSASCEAQITVIDSIPPTANCIADNSIFNLDENGTVLISGNDIDNGSSDVSGIASIEVSPNQFSCEDIGEVTVNLTVTDTNGNSSSCNTILQIVDFIAPVIECPEAIEATSTDGNPLELDIELATATDNCTSTISFERSDNESTFNAPFQIGTTEIVWTATDASGNATSCTQSITITRALSTENAITSFFIEQQQQTILNDETSSIQVTVTPETDLSALLPIIVVSEGATINPPSGTAQDFTIPVTYTVTAENEMERLWTVSVERANTAPIILTDSMVSVPENQILVLNVEATDDNDIEGDGLLYSISGGIDAALFSIDAVSGEVVFNTAPDFEMPEDVDEDNLYQLELTVTDSAGLFSAQELLITVLNEEEPLNLGITDFYLINADTDTRIVQINEGDEINLSSLPTLNLNIEAVATNDTQSVRLILTGEQAHAMTENFVPYALFGDISGDFMGNTFLDGNYSISATPFSADRLNGMSGPEMNLNFSFITPPPPPLSILGFIVVDADSNTEIGPLTNGMNIEAANLPSNLDIVALTTDDAQSVQLLLTGALVQGRTENFVPYALFGDIEGNFIGSQQFEVGNYVLTATAFSGNGTTGEEGVSVTINFSISEEATTSSIVFNKMVLVPNPANEIVQLVFEQPIKDVELIEIFDATGRLLKQVKVRRNTHEEGYRINVHDFAEGTYFIRTTDTYGLHFQQTLLIDRKK